MGSHRGGTRLDGITLVRPVLMILCANINNFHDYLHQGRLCNHWGLSVCLFVCEQRNSKNYEWIFFKFSESAHLCLSKK